MAVPSNVANQAPIADATMDIDMDIDLGLEPEPIPEPEPIQTVSAPEYLCGNQG